LQKPDWLQVLNLFLSTLETRAIQRNITVVFHIVAGGPPERDGDGSWLTREGKGLLVAHQRGKEMAGGSPEGERDGWWFTRGGRRWLGGGWLTRKGKGFSNGFFSKRKNGDQLRII